MQTIAVASPVGFPAAVARAVVAATAAVTVPDSACL